MRNLLIDKLDDLPASAVMRLSDGSAIPVGEFLTLLRMADWELYPENHDFGNGGVGQAVRNDGDPILRISINALMTYAQNPATLAFHLLHEIGHVTLSGYLRWAFDSDPRSDGGATQTPAEWLANEVFSNDMAREFGRILEVAVANVTETPFGSLTGVLDVP